MADAEEDTFLNGHKTVWGSWYDTEAKKWGFACCKSFDKGGAPASLHLRSLAYVPGPSASAARLARCCRENPAQRDSMEVLVSSAGPGWT